MTKTLRKQLALLAFGGAVTLGWAFRTRHLAAQDEIPQSAAEAAQLFGRLLAANDPDLPGNGRNSDLNLARVLIARANEERLVLGSLTPLLQRLQVAATRPAFDVVSQSTAGDTTVVQIAPAPKASALPVVVVQENGEFRVDLLATYAKRMRIAEKELPDAIYNATNGETLLEGSSYLALNYVQNNVCQSRLKQIYLAIAEYTQDYDEVFPRAQNWQGNLYPYLRNRKDFTCPAVAQNGYALNANLTQKPFGDSAKDAGNKSSIIMAYETSDLRPNAVGIGQDLAFRHKPYEESAPGANFLFADGHVRFRTSQKIPDFSLNPLPPKKMP